MTTKPIVDEPEQGVVSQLEFLDLFDLEEIRKTQDAFAVAAGVASVITYPDGRPITRPANFSRLCSGVIRKTEKGLADCLHFHSELGCNNPNGLTIKSCFIRGLWVGCAGISVGEKHIANWIVGQVRSDTPDTEEIIRYAGEIGADEQEFRFALEEIMVMPFNRFEQVCNFLFLMANLMSKIAFQNVSHASHIRRAQKVEAMGTMAGGFAHDFNNILGIILGNTELALEDIPKSNPAKFNLEEVRIACMRAKDVVSQIHSFAGRTEGKMKPVRITPIVRESVKMLRASIPATIDINLDVTAENDMIMADPARIHQVTVNLVNNAAFEMWEIGGILNIGIENVAINRYEVAVYDDISPGKYVRLTVRDTGKGIDPEIIDLIFDPYFTTKKIGQGAGMGLSVVQGIVGSHNGRVMAESEPGQGATFQVFFPVVEKKSNLSGESGKDVLAGNERILFVDDEPSLAKLGEIILNRLGYSVVSVAGTIKALEIFEADPDGFDLLVTDYAMPDMNGVILAKRIKKIRPDIPVILCTGFNEHVTDEKIMVECITTVMIKPINRLTLSGTVREVLDKQ
ncbi:MAG: PocR ligand-binding domain-containing protein [Thermodesulfobacteriota bacterium]|nr:PocR ligand-binding domain-containing protein [Thermodesulfobacteriota bacterium]